MSIATTAPAEMETLKSRLKSTWMAGDYDRFSRFMEPGYRSFYERLNLRPGSRLLDVGCGSGPLALMAAADGIQVTGVDIAPNLVERARLRARARGLAARFEVADAEDLPFADGSFDNVASMVGAMFAPRPERVASELARVCRRGGTIAMGNWTPQGFVGKMFQTIGHYIAPSGMPSPVLWGDEATVRQRFGSSVAELQMTRRMYTFDYPFPPSEVVEFFRRYYGPAHRAFASLDHRDSDSLRSELEFLWSSQNRADDGFTVVEAEYLEVMATRA